MTYYIVVREIKDGTTEAAAARNLLHSGIMSHCSAAFYLFLFQEITLQLSVLLAAIFFIFFMFPIVWCLITLPLVAAVVYFFTYTTHVFKAGEVTQLKPRCRWIAEAYEPYFLTADPQTVRYVILDDAEADTTIVEIDSLRKKVIGTVSLQDFHGPHDSVWLYGLAVDPKYRRKGVARALASAAVQWSRHNSLDSVELATTHLQHEARLLFQQLGFEMRQMYHKQLLGAALTLPMYHQGLEVSGISR